MNHLRLAAILTTLFFALSSALLGATEVRFEHTTYQAQPGDTIVLKTTFSQPVPAGLEAYGLRLTFPAAGVTLGEGDIFVPPALNHDLFSDNPADRHVSLGYATVEGFTEFGQGPYHGTEFATFTVTIPPNAPGGTYSLNLGLADAGGNNFIDGNTQVIDGQLIFGSATLVIEGQTPVQVDEIAWVPGTGNLRLTFSGAPGATYTIEASTNLSAWSDLATLTAEPDGTFEYTDLNAQQLSRRFYRAKPE